MEDSTGSAASSEKAVAEPVEAVAELVEAAVMAVAAMVMAVGIECMECTFHFHPCLLLVLGFHQASWLNPSR